MPNSGLGDMGYEVEIKFHVADLANLERRLRSLSTEPAPPVAQEDTYLAHPSRDFAVTNEAFRFRREGSTNRLTYKGPKHDGPTKTREEIEVAFADGETSRDDMARLFDRLGFRPVLTIRKVRRTFHLERAGRSIEVALDDAEGLGFYVEVEALADRPEALAEAQAAVLDLAKELGLVEVEPRSYLRMQLERQGLLPPNPAIQA
jgi:adenylate cyclase class 2